MKIISVTNVSVILVELSHLLKKIVIIELSLILCREHKTQTASF